METINHSQRSAVIAVVFKLHPTTQPIKERVVGDIISQIYLNKAKFVLSVEEIQEYLKNVYDINFSLQKINDFLENSDLFEKDDNKYRLSNEAAKRLKKIKEESERRYIKVVKSLFGDVNIKAYTEIFLRFLGRIFSKITEEYVRLLKGEIDSLNLIGKKYFEEVLNEIIKNSLDIDNEKFAKGVEKFFTYTDPDYDYIKWVVAQSYYFIRVIGLDPSGYLLTEDKFKESIFYLDTNILVAYILSSHHHHTSVVYFIDSLKKLKAKARIALISIDELEKWVDYRLDILKKTFSVIPDSIGLQCPIYLEFRNYVKDRYLDSNTINEFINNIWERVWALKDTFEVIDDPWFHNKINDQETISLANSLKIRYFKMKKENKSESAALHDALLLHWIDNERKSTKNNKIWLVTLDTSLPSAIYEGRDTISINLDALLQWFSPFSDDRPMEEIFSNLVKNRFFPQEKIFDLKDFLVFYELEIKAKDLPPEDIKDALIYLRKKFGEIDLNSSKNLSEISYELARFFVDPSRKYHLEIKKAYEREEKLKKEYENKLGRLREEIKRMREQYERQLKEKDKKLNDFQERLARIEDERRLEKLKNSAKSRLKVIGLLWAALISATLYFSSKYSVGENLFQKIANSFDWFILETGIVIVGGWFYIGKERLITLGWPFNKIFKIDEK